MLKLFLLAVLLFPVHTFANSDVVQNKETPCATQAFADGLKQHAAAISDAESESTISEWVRIVFADKTVLENVLNCPEVASIEDTETIKFSTIKYKFPSGREVSIQYETQPKVLKQRLLLANKRQLPSSNAQGHNPNLENIAENESTVWINTNPAWYAIMVVESGSLNHFVGTEKNNTISLDYIIENIDSLYPQGARCTSRSALAEDYCAINRAVHKTVDLEDDSNDYYVAGDIDLRWIAYAEIALDVALTFCTSGGYLALAGLTKAARASRALKGMSVVLKNLRKTEAVTKYIKATGKITQLKNSLKGINLAKLSKLDNVKKYTKNMEKIGKLQKEIDKMDKVADAAKIADKTKELDKLKDASKSFEKLDDVKQYNQAMKTTDEIKSLEKQVDSMNKIDNVKKYKEISDTYSKLHSYRKALRGIKNLTPQRGNVIARTVTAAKNTKKIYKSAKAAMTGGKLIKKGAKLGKASKFSTRIKDTLFHTTLKHAGAVAKAASIGSMIYGGLMYIGGFMYDFTETSTGEYTNGVDFKPLLLLSADDIQQDGQADKINYGMWIMWLGDSISVADDDAAYLQAMDFASKFHEDLMDEQDNENSPCNVDIYVVKPILQNPDTENAKIYYLIMNDTPWSTNQ